MFTIGEFSKITSLTVKALRFYHEEGLLVPSFVDPESGYRYYDASKIETARLITLFRSMEMPIEQIRDVLRGRDDDEAMLALLERQRAMLREKQRQYGKALRVLDQFLKNECEMRETMNEAKFEVVEKDLPSVVIAGLRMKGRYQDCGKGFGQLARKVGRWIAGKPMLLCYDHEYKETDADFEVCFPLKGLRSVAGVDVRELPGGRCLSLLHKGPYDQVGPSYGRLLAFAKSKGLAFVCPTREVYLKGPGMIFKGNPKNYLTEIQLLLDSPGAAHGK